MPAGTIRYLIGQLGLIEQKQAIVFPAQHIHRKSTTPTSNG
jgi:hypothetical protein